ncbi:MAG: hypothetical protein IJL26_02335 [Clostridia bacterium]|nr:hypothetical protein [Clostridia bacterium]
MKKSFLRKTASLVLIGCILFAVFCIPASANSGPRRWEGLTQSGVTFTGEDCPIEVTHEKLTLAVTDEPVPESTDASYWAEYANEVTAEYTFFNPTQDTITATLTFPCGSLPEYALERTEKLAPEDLIAYHEKYGAYVNGEKIGTTARYSLNYGNTATDFDVVKLLSELEEEPVVTDVLSPETPVTINLYKVSGVNRLPSDYFTGAGLLVTGGPERIVYLANMDRERYHDSLGSSRGDRYVSQVENGDRLLAVVFGDLTGADIEWEFRKSADGDPPAAGEATLVSSESITFGEFCERGKTVYPDASFTDLFNATSLLLRERLTDRVLDLDFEKTGAAPIPDLMCCYEYEITLAPGETLTNTVRAPLYPEIYDGTRPRKYEYTYLLSPAAGWAKFGTLEIGIDTPFYLLEESLDGFEKTDGGYRLIRDGLPDGELTFTLCKSPVRIPVPYGMGWAAAAFVLALFIGVIVGIVALIRVLYKLRKNKIN